MVSVRSANLVSRERCGCTHIHVCTCVLVSAESDYLYEREMHKLKKVKFYIAVLLLIADGCICHLKISVYWELCVNLKSNATVISHKIVRSQSLPFSFRIPSLIVHICVLSQENVRSYS